MHGCIGWSGAIKRCLLTIAVISLGGCLESENEQSAIADSPDDAEVQNDAEKEYDQELTGSVGDGPIVGAAMRVIATDGSVIAELQSDSNAGYNVSIRTKGKYYPLSIDARNGVDLVTNLAPDFDLQGVAIEPGKKTVANLNPFSTFAVEMARHMPGGLTKSNLEKAEGTVSRKLNSGLLSLLEGSFMSSPIDRTNLAEIIKSSETLGETVRRVRDLQNSTGRASSGNVVVKSVSVDLVDGVIDGKGPQGVDKRVAALTTVVSALTLLESMQNELHVNEANATAAMEAAMFAVSSAGSDKTFEDLVVTAEMLEAVRIGLDACLAIAPSPELQEIEEAVASLQSGMTPANVRPLVPDHYRSTLRAAITAVANGTDADIETVNSISRDGGDTPIEGNNPPVISGTPAATAEEGARYSFTPSASDPDGDTLTFTISGRPSWASFDAATGTLSGSAPAGSAGEYPNIIIGVTDGQASDELPTFSITVTTSEPNNSPPTISGSPATSVQVGSPYSFTPSASDPDGDTVTFAITGRPDWAAFDTATGALTGTPVAGDENIYSDIVISVSDGEFTESLPPFSIEVIAADTGTGSATLSWTAPTQNEDGSALTDLAGYTLRWGTTSGSYPNSVTIDNPSVLTYTVDGLSAGTYFFVATSFNTSGIESRYSGEATKTVP